MTIYMPDDLAAEVKDKLGDQNISAICQGALRAELARAEARTALDAEAFERVQLEVERFDGQPKDHPVSFLGREVASAEYHDQTAWITPKGTIVVHDAHDDRGWTYGDYDAFIQEDQPASLAEGVAEALGEEYVEDLDI